MEEIREILKEHVPKRKESYVAKTYPDVYNYIMSSYPDFDGYKLKLTAFIYQNGYCLHCKSRTSFSSGEGFRKYCNSKCAKAHKGTDIFAIKPDDYDDIKYLYLDQKKSPKEIGELYNCSHTTVWKTLVKLNIARSRSEQQQIHHIKGHKTWNGNIDFESSILEDVEFLTNENKTKTLQQIANELGCSSSLIQQTFKRYGIPVVIHDTSSLEMKIRSILDDLNIKYISNYFDEYVKKEIDIYVPDYKLGIECNGLYWHSEKFKHKNYHLDKTKSFGDIGIQILHFWEHEINDKYDIVVGMIKSKLGINTKIYARKCDVRDVDTKTATEFINRNHIQGYIGSSIKKGLYYNEELVCLATFSKPRYDKQYDLELIRFCSKQGYTIIGGFSKIISKMPTNTSILSYANRRFSIGKVYESCGFKLIRESSPGFFWFNSNGFKIKHRLQDTRHYKVLQEEGTYRVFDCGNLVYVKHL